MELEDLKTKLEQLEISIEARRMENELTAAFNKYTTAASKKKHFVPLDRDRINKANNDLRLRRTKPLPDSKNTLESCMDLKYV